MKIALEVTELTKHYPGHQAVNNISFTIESHEFFSLIGPSGCGKTTTLRCVAGLETAQAGVIKLGDNCLLDTHTNHELPTNKRPIGMVFQSYAVWPHMTVFENIAYPLKIKGERKATYEPSVMRLLALLGMESLASRMPSELSGGQQQRVALGRALATKPDLLLLDEPLSNLDAKLRESMRAELKQIQRETGLPILYVTHDQEEALALSDRIAVMYQGKIHQLATPDEVYHRPATRFVLEFIGHINYLPAKVIERGDAQTAVSCGEANEASFTLQTTLKTPETHRTAQIAFRPEQVQLIADPVKHQADDLIKGHIVIQSFLGHSISYQVRIGDHQITALCDTSLRFNEGQTVWVKLLDGLVLSDKAESPDTPIFA